MSAIARRRRGRLPDATGDSIPEAFEDLKADYQAAKTSRFQRRRTGISLTGSNADYHYRTEADYLRVMEYARDMERNDPLVGPLVERVIDNTVQSGFRLDFQTGDDRIDADLAARWREWSSDPAACDVAGELTFSAMEQMALRRMLVDGDLIVLPVAGGERSIQAGPPRDGGRLQMIEGHRVRSPSNRGNDNIVHGVKLGARRERLAFWFTRDEIPPMASVLKTARMISIDAWSADGIRQVFQIYNPKRVSQTRGVSAFAPIFDRLGMFEDVDFARLLQQQIVSCFAVLEELAEGAETPDGGSPQFGARETTTHSDGVNRIIEGISPGMIYTGAPGSKLTGFSPNVPNPEFFPHVRHILQLISINLGVPLILLLMDASETNFSGWRGATDEARRGFRRNQNSLIERLHRPVHRWKVSEWVDSDPALRRAAERTRRPINIYGHRWYPPRWPYIQPLQDNQADSLELRDNRTSYRRQLARRGEDWSEVAAELVEDRALIAEAAILRAEQINAAHPGAALDWRELAGFDIKARALVNATRTRTNGNP